MALDMLPDNPEASHSGRIRAAPGIGVDAARAALDAERKRLMSQGMTMQRHRRPRPQSGDKSVKHLC